MFLNKWILAFSCLHHAHYLDCSSSHNFNNCVVDMMWKRVVETEMSHSTPRKRHCPSLSLLVGELSPSNLQESWVWGLLGAFIWLNSPVTSHILRVESRFPFSRTRDLGATALDLSLYFITQLPAFLAMGALFAVGSLHWCLSPSCVCALGYLSLPYSLLQSSEGWCSASAPGETQSAS